MTATATKPRKKTAKPKPTVLEVAVPMPSYEDLVAELGIDPDAIYREFDELWASGWALADALDLLGPLVGPADYQPEDPEPVDEPTSLLGLVDYLTAEIPTLTETPEETR